MISAAKKTKIVIVGGGFAGIEAAVRLAKNPLADVTIVSNNSCFQYYPSLYRLVVGATVNQVSIPLNKIIPKNVTLTIDTYTGIDQAHQVITLKSGAVVAYDHLVMALGSEPNYFGIDGMETHSKSFLSIEKAVALNKYFIDLIAQAKTLPREEAAMKLHTIIVGAGPSGVELAGALRPYLARQAKKQGVNPDLVSVDLLDSGARVLPAIPERASVLVAAQLQKQGVKLYANYGVNACDDHCVIVANKSSTDPAQQDLHMEAGTVVWTAGTKISTTFTTIPNITLTDRKRVEVTATLSLPSDSNIYVIGDGSGTPFSGLAQTAIDQGQYVAAALSARMAGKDVAAYVPQAGIFVIPVGKWWAILNKKEFVWSGPAAWLIRIIVDIRYFLSITSVWNVLGMLFRKDNENNK